MISVTTRSVDGTAALAAAIAALSRPGDVIVLTGTDPAFCAGLDLSELSDRSAAEGVYHSRGWHRTFEKIQFGQVPVVAPLARDEMGIVCNVNADDVAAGIASGLGARQ